MSDPETPADPIRITIFGGYLGRDDVPDIAIHADEVDAVRLYADRGIYLRFCIQRDDDTIDMNWDGFEIELPDEAARHLAERITLALVEPPSVDAEDDAD